MLSTAFLTAAAPKPLQKGLTTSLVAVAILLSACQQEGTSASAPVIKTTANETQLATAASNPDVNAATQAASVVVSAAAINPASNVAAPKPISAPEVTFKAIPLDYSLPKQVAKLCSDAPDTKLVGCPVVDIKLAAVQPKWVEQAINLAITDDNSPHHNKFKRELDRFALSQFEDESPLGYSMEIQPDQQKAYNNVAQFSILSDQYLGGAHGMPNIDYLLFDMSLQSQIELADVLADKEDKFYALAHQAFLQYLTDEMDIAAPDDVASYEETWPFELSEVFYFADAGLVLVYQPYQLGSFAQGFIELTIPYGDLQGVLKTDYLPK